MYVFHAWKSSLELFLPKNLSLFLLVTLKLIRDGLKTYFKYGWPFFIVALVGLFMTFYSVDIYGRILHNEQLAQHLGERSVVMIAVSLGYLLVQLCYALSSFFVALSMRPSVDKKNCAYMRKYAKKYFFGYLLLQALFFMFFMIPFCLISSSICCSLDIDFTVSQYYLSVVLNILATLFYLDLNRSFVTIPKAVWFSIKMGFYNLPFVAIVTLTASALLHVLSLCPPIIRVLWLLVYPLLFALVTNYYTKKVHDQARLYQG